MQSKTGSKLYLLRQKMISSLSDIEASFASKKSYDSRALQLFISSRTSACHMYFQYSRKLRTVHHVQQRHKTR